MLSVMFEVGWCGFGASGGLVPELRLGLIRFAATRGSVVARLRGILAALHLAHTELSNRPRPRIVPAPPPKGDAA